MGRHRGGRADKGEIEMLSDSAAGWFSLIDDKSINPGLAYRVWGIVKNHGGIGSHSFGGITHGGQSAQTTQLFIKRTQRSDWEFAVADSNKIKTGCTYHRFDVGDLKYRYFMTLLL